MIRTGASFSGKERNFFFWNNNNKFQDVSQISGANHIGDSRSFSKFDFNRDGRTDIALANTNAPSFRIYENKANSGNFSIAMRFIGGNHVAQPSSQWSNRDGYGTRVKLYLPNMQIMREFRCGEGYNTQNSSTMLVGIGKNRVVPKIEVFWPSGKKQVLKDIKEDSLVKIYEKTLSHTVEKYSVALPKNRYVKHKKSQFYPQGYASKSKINLFITMATWCATCKRELPYLKELRQTFSEKQLSMVGIAISDKDTPKNLQEYQAPYKIYGVLTAQDKANIDRLLTKKLYSSTVLPSYIITDKNNNVLFVDLGLPNISTIRKLLHEDR